MGTEKAKTYPHWDERGKRGQKRKRIRTDRSGPEGEKNRAEPLVPPSERRRKKGASRESKRGQRKRAQVMVLSCWCHRQIQAVQPPGCHLHLTQYPLYSQYHASLFRCGRLPWCGRLTAPFLSPQQTAAASHSPVIPTVCSALPAQTVLSALFCLSLLFPFAQLGHSVCVFGTRSVCFPSRVFLTVFCHCRKL